MPKNIWSSKPSRTILFVIVFAMAPLVIPGLRDRLSVKGESYRELLPHASELVSFKQRSVSATTLAPANESLTENAEPPKPANQVCADQLIEDPDNAMQAFNESLAHTDDKVKGAITRITH